MKLTTKVLVGIATLFFGTFGSVATEADDECYEHIINAVRIHGSSYAWIIIRDAYGKGPIDAKYRVYNVDGDLLTFTINYRSDITIPLNGSHMLTTGNVRGVRENNADRFRHVHITTDRDAIVTVWARWTSSNDGLYNMPVHKRQLTNTKTWEAPCDPPDDKKS